MESNVKINIKPHSMNYPSPCFFHVYKAKIHRVCHQSYRIRIKNKRIDLVVFEYLEFREMASSVQNEKDENDGDINFTKSDQIFS